MSKAKRVFNQKTLLNKEVTMDANPIQDNKLPSDFIKFIKKDKTPLKDKSTLEGKVHAKASKVMIENTGNLSNNLIKKDTFNKNLIKKDTFNKDVIKKTPEEVEQGLAQIKAKVVNEFTQQINQLIEDELISLLPFDPDEVQKQLDEDMESLIKQSPKEAHPKQVEKKITEEKLKGVLNHFFDTTTELVRKNNREMLNLIKQPKKDSG